MPETMITVRIREELFSNVYAFYYYNFHINLLTLFDKIYLQENTMMLNIDHFYMNQALMLARRGELTVSPNPMVGCIIVKNGFIIGEGFHHSRGESHAEIMALSSSLKSPKDSTLYTTLEPCCHIGVTTACSNALIKAGIKKVVIASIDPNPKVAGKGIKILKTHGIQVHLGILENEAKLLNKIFFHYHYYNRPYVFAKWGMSLDGETKTGKNDNKKITNTAVQMQNHNLRNRCDAIMVGSKTILEDNPSLTVRFSNATKINQPLRVIISKTANLPTNAKVFITKEAPTIIFTTQKANHKCLQILKRKGVLHHIIHTNNNAAISIKSVLKILAKKGITSLLVEGGKELHHAFFKENMVNEVYSFIAPVIINGYIKKYPVKNITFQPIKNNIFLTGKLEKL